MEEWIKDCEFLSPYLKEKLTQDKEHTWRDAPYIPDEIKDMLREAAPPRNPSISYPINTQNINYSLNCTTTAQALLLNYRMQEMNAATFQARLNERMKSMIRACGGGTFYY